MTKNRRRQRRIAVSITVFGAVIGFLLLVVILPAIG